MADHIQLPAKIWTRLNLAWVAFFVLYGVVNLYVALNFDEATRVNFKLFGMLGLTVVFVVAQSIYLAKHAVEVKK
jgi:intracellular septation protein